MKQDQFTGREQVAVRLGADKAGEYLDQIGKTDLATLSQEEWAEFWKRGIAGYRIALKSAVQNEAPF